ncbi:MAG: lysophospholipid acyltransferase family protein [Chloroflexales bacterium]|nr:lysophospholipid acyltransferase family protein [Chloroflexales bacterium]
MPKTSHDLPTIPAAKTALGDELIYRALVRWSLWNGFERVSAAVRGALPQHGPLIVYLNHPGWWDGYMCFLIARKLLRQRFDGYIMMEEPQLRAYRFFSWCGAFSIDRSSPRAAARSVAYISRVLRERRERALYIFPQGEIAPNDRRPLTIFSGLAHIVRRVGGATLLPVALRYEFRGEQRPEAFMLLGPAHRAEANCDVRALNRSVAARLTESVDTLRDLVLAEQLAGFQTLVRGRPGVNRVFDGVFGQLMGKL